MFIALLFALITSVGVTVGILSLKDMAQDLNKFKGRLSIVVAFSAIVTLILIVLVALLGWKISPSANTPVLAPTQQSSNVTPGVASVIPPLVVTTVVPTLAPTPVAIKEVETEKMEFGGVLIKNPAKRAFSVLILNENGEYYKWVMTNSHKEEVTTSWDTRYAIPVEDNNSYFEGKVVIDGKEYPFSFDSAVDGTSVKDVNI